jgi:hypothetical protein
LDFLGGCNIEISIRLMAARAAPPKPRVGDGASGAGSQGAFRPQVSDSTAPNAVKCQSFLDNVIAQFGRIRAWDDRGS